MVVNVNDDGRKLDVGNVLDHPEGHLEVTGVKYGETEDGVKHSFEYTLRHKDELDAEREAQKELDEEIARQAEEARVAAEASDDAPALG